MMQRRFTMSRPSQIPFIVLLVLLAGPSIASGQSCLFSEPASSNCLAPRVISGSEGHHVVLMDVHDASDTGTICNVSVGHKVYFSVTPEVGGPMTVTTCHPMTMYDTVLQVATHVELCETGDIIACNDDSSDPYCGSSCSGRASKVTFDATAGETYRIRVGSYGNNSAGCTLCLGLIVTIGDPCGEPPRNFVCQEGFALSGEVGSHELTVDATDAPLNTQSWSCPSSIEVSHPVWFAFVPDISGTATFTTCHPNTDYDTVIRAVSACAGTVITFACNDDMGGCGTNSLASEVSFDVTAGNEYFVAVGSYGTGAAGCLGVQLTLTGGCSGDADCDDGNPCTLDRCLSGSCSNTLVEEGTPCPDDGNPCTADICNGTGECTHPDEPRGTPCGDGSDTACTDPDTCNGAGVCEANDEPFGTPCPDDGNECTADICNDSGQCAHPFSPAGTPCGDPSDTACTDPDTCNGAGGCERNDAPVGTSCPDGLFCNGEESCDGTGNCWFGEPPCLAPEICDEELDRCGLDCNGNGILDDVDIEQGTSKDCNFNLVPDECEPDADGDGVPDDCDVCPGFDDNADDDQDTIPDGCDICPGGDDRVDTDGDGVPDACDECPGMDDHAVIGPPFPISSGSSDNGDPDVAFNSVASTWLVVWAEADPINPANRRNMIRVLDSGGSPLGGAVALSGFESHTMGARVSYDPVENEWVIVWCSQDPIEQTEWRIFARRVSSFGVPIGTEPLLVKKLDEESPVDISAGMFESGIGSPESFFLIVWEENWQGTEKRIYGVHIQKDADPDTGLAVANTPFVLDSSAEFPIPRKSLRPRIADPAPVVVSTGEQLSMQTVHPVVFEVSYGNLSDIFLVTTLGPTVKSTLRITETQTTLTNETLPILSYNDAMQRGLVVYLQGSQAYGQYLSFPGNPAYPALLSDPFLISSSDQFSLDAHPTSERFFMGLHIPAGMEGYRLAGKNIALLFGNISGQDQPVIRLNTNNGDCYLLAYRSKPLGENGSILGRLHCGCWGGENQLPAANAGADIDPVVEGAIFQLDGSMSSDPDGDPLSYRWTQTAGEAVAFVDESDGRNQEMPYLVAPLLDSGESSRTVVFELAVDDLRSAAPFPSSDTVSVRIVPGDDVNPPVADAGPDFTVDEDSWAQLNGCGSSDPDGDPLSFLWQVETLPPEMTSLTIQDPLLCNATFTAPRFAKAGGVDVVFGLRVNNDRGGVDQDTVTVHVNDTVNEWPVAEAGPAFTVYEHSMFTLDATGSTDPNGDPLTYQWEVISFLDAHEEVVFPGPLGAWSNATASVRQDKDITLRLTVTDGRGGSDSDEVVVHVLSTPMQVFSYTPDTGSPGTKVTISGTDLLSVQSVNFNGWGGTIESRSDTQIVVSVPNGNPVYAPGGDFYAGSKLGWMRVQERPQVTTGPLAITGEKNSWTSSKDFVVLHPALAKMILSQGVNGYELVKKKHTLLQVQVRTGESVPGKNADLSEALCYVEPSVGDPFTVAASNVPPKALPSKGVLGNMSEGINFFLPPDKLTAPQYKFTVVVENNGFEVLHIESNQLSAEFADVVTPRIAIRPVVPFVSGSIKPGFDWNRWWTRFHQARETFVRLYPIADADFVVSPTSWRAPNLLGDDDRVHLPKNDFFGIVKILPSIVSMHNFLDDWNSGNPTKKAMYSAALIDEDLYPSGAASGFGEAPRSMMAHVVKFILVEDIPYVGPVIDVLNDVIGGLACILTATLWCPDPISEAVEAFFDILDAFGVDVGGVCSFSFLFDNRSGSLLGHEMGHVLGFVDPYTDGKATVNHNPDNVTHCVYDETPATMNYLNGFGVTSPVFNVLPPGDLMDGTNLPKSLMSYAKPKNDDNAFFLPHEYNRIRKGLLKPTGTSSLSSGGTVTPSDSNGAPYSKKLKVTGYLDLVSGEVTVVESKPLPAETADSLELPDSRLRIAFLDSQGQIIEESGFGFNIPIASELATEPFIIQYATFSVVRAFPDSTDAVAVYYLDAVGWSAEPSPNPPSVTLLAPTGGEYMESDDEFIISWTAQDLDGDDLTFSVYYSSDGGATFTPLVTGITERSFNWGTMFAQGSPNALIKVAASDGFNLGEAVSGPFTVAEKLPVPYIVAPEEGAQIPSTLPLHLEGSCFDLKQSIVRDDTAFSWYSSLDGALGVGRNGVVRNLSVGVHEIALTVTVEGKEQTTSVFVEILSDRDGDGISDLAEESDPLLDPDNPDDAMSDLDDDGLTLASEVLRFGTNPSDPDSDLDGHPDGVEVERGGHPANPDVIPPPYCEADMDVDTDVDGKDLAIFALQRGNVTIEDLALEFGRLYCH